MTKTKNQLQWRVKELAEMTFQEIHDSFKLRADVFVVEQNCVFPDIDGKDDQAVHIMGYDGKELVAYTRVFDKGVYTEMASLGRVVVAKEKRRFRYGRELVTRSLETIYRNYGQQPVHISAQCEYADFYKGLGFKEVGEAYLEDGIPHIGMERP